MNLNFNEICRLCLRICEEYIDLNQTNGVKTLADDLVEKIKYCYFVQVDLSEGFPTKVCYECIQVLTFFYTSKKNVITSDKLLRDILFMRKKLDEEIQSRKEENVTSVDIIEIKQDEQKAQTKNSETNESDQNSIIAKDVELNCSSNINNSETSGSPIVQTENEMMMNCDTDGGPTLVPDKHESKVKRRKKLEPPKQTVASSDPTENNNVAKLLTPTNSNLKLLIKNLKREQCQQGNTSQSAKDQLQLEVDRPLKENVVKEIGTVIDTNNILSPNVKRTRKSLMAR